MTHENLRQAAASTIAHLGIRQGDCLLSLVGSRHLGRRRHVYMALLSGASVIVPVDLGKGWVDTVTMPRPSIVLATTRIARELIDPGERPLLPSGPRGQILDLCRAGAAFYVTGPPLSPNDEERLEREGCTTFTVYGLTEACGWVAANTPLHRRRGTTGKLLPGIECRIDERGEVLLRGPVLSPGYLGDTQRTRRSWHESWFHTGDYGELDPHGYLRILGRVNERARLPDRTWTVLPELEARIEAHPAIRRAVLMTAADGAIEGALLVLEKGTQVKAPRRDDLDSKPSSWSRLIGGLLGAGLEEVPVAILERDLQVDQGELTGEGKLRRGMIAKLHGGRFTPGSSSDP